MGSVFFKAFLVIIQFVLVTTAYAMETPAQYVMPYDSIGLPPQLGRTEVQWLIQSAATRLYGEAFVDLGHMSDFMHGHVLFRPTSPMGNPVKQLTDVTWTPEWSKLEAVGILFHSQEYNGLRNGVPYVGPNGELDELNRNYILFLKDAENYKRGDIVPATDVLEKPVTERPFTVYSSELKKSIFGEDPNAFEYSFYFFRTQCEGPESAMSVVDIAVNNQRYCLNVQSFYCRNHPTEKQCVTDHPLVLDTSITQ